MDIFSDLLDTLFKSVSSYDEHTLQITKRDHSIVFELGLTKLVLKLYLKDKEIKSFEEKFEEEERTLGSIYCFLLKIQQVLTEEKENLK